MLIYYYLPSIVFFFTQIDEVIDIVGDFKMRVIIAICLIPDLVKNMQSGMIKALGYQVKAIEISFVGNWIICVGLIGVFCFWFNFNLQGLWLAKFIADVIIMIRHIILLNFS